MLCTVVDLFTLCSAKMSTDRPLGTFSVAGLIQCRSQPHCPGWARVPLSSFFPKFWSFFLIFPQIFLIFFLILALRVGNSPTREGPWLRHWSNCINVSRWSPSFLSTTVKEHPAPTVRPIFQKIVNQPQLGWFVLRACHVCDPRQHVSQTLSE